MNDMLVRGRCSFSLREHSLICCKASAEWHINEGDMCMIGWRNGLLYVVKWKSDDASEMFRMQSFFILNEMRKCMRAK